MDASFSAAGSALSDLRTASFVLQDEWREGSDPRGWRRVKWDADGGVTEL
jgi:hypothetical protein